MPVSEPNVVSLVALSFDEDGRMFVVEMRDYSEHHDEKLGRIRMLEDTDGDFRYLFFWAAINRRDRRCLAARWDSVALP